MLFSKYIPNSQKSAEIIDNVLFSLSTNLIPVLVLIETLLLEIEVLKHKNNVIPHVPRETFWLEIMESLQLIKNGEPTDEMILSFVETKDIVGFTSYAADEKRYSVD